MPNGTDGQQREEDAQDDGQHPHLAQLGQFGQRIRLVEREALELRVILDERGRQLLPGARRARAWPQGHELEVVLETLEQPVEPRAGDPAALGVAVVRAQRHQAAARDAGLDALRGLLAARPQADDRR